jgi:SAM-dependent methyltransferase
MCLRCRGQLVGSVGEITCVVCGSRYPLVEGVPVLTPEPHAAEVRPADHRSHQLPPDLVARLASLDGYWLNLGAGATERPIENCIEVEYHVFRHTTIVADAGALPFVDGSIAAAVSFNTFEHLRDPAAAASELRRVLVPEGEVIVQSAFLQPLHEEEHHYYNATESGLRHWFREFEVTACEVSENMNPAYALAWLASDLLFFAGPDAARTLAGSRLEEWAEFWRDADRRAGPLWDVMTKLPDTVQRRLAAGFELRARKPIEDREEGPRSASTP